ncbi:hypothetical protein E1J77_14165 [Salmonella enterica subsp. enterica serovar Typhimurium]|nr:hypothetical protein [Salmonella enterica subsp. enterica serovar Typhimurium]
MTKTLNPTITVTVSGPTGSGKSRVLAVIADVLKLIHSDCIIEAPDVKAEKEMCGDDHTAWHNPHSGTIFKLEEVNLPVENRNSRIRNMSYAEALALFKWLEFRDSIGHSLTMYSDFRELLDMAFNHQDKPVREITVDDLVDRPVPVHILEPMSKLGISFDEYKETDLQPVVDLVNWALTTPKIPEPIPQPDTKNGAQATSADKEDVIRDILNGAIAVLDCQKKQQAHRQRLTEEIRQELLNIIHNRLG